MSSSDDHSQQQEKKEMSSSDNPSPPQEKKQMSSGDDQSPPKKKQKDFFVSYYDRETYYKEFNNHSILDDEKGVMSDSDSDFTEEEEKIYRDAIKASDGFDVPAFPKVSLCGVITPMSVNERSLKDLLPFSIAAMNTYNEKKGTEYKVVQVEKAMQQAARGLNHYITFLAKIDEDDDTIKTFEALVLMGIPEKKGDDATEVIFCREKGAKKVAAEEELENEDGDSGSVEEEEEVEGKKMDEFVGA